MAGFFQWVGHRKELVGYASWTGFCRAVGIHRSRIELLRAGASPRAMMGDQELGRVARLLHASHRQVRLLADGAIEWIDDSHWVSEAERPGRTGARWRNSSQDIRRTAAIGKIMPEGMIELEQDWNAEFGPWIPTRLGSGRGTFALRVMPFDPEYPVERWMIFRLVRRDVLPDGQDVAMFISDGVEERGMFGRLHVIGEEIVLQLEDRRRQKLEIDRGKIMQLARAVGHWPEGKLIEPQRTQRMQNNQLQLFSL